MLYCIAEGLFLHFLQGKVSPIHEAVLPVHHIESLQVSQCFADLHTVLY